MPQLKTCYGIADITYTKKLQHMDNSTYDAALTVRHTLVHLHQSLNISTNNTWKEETFSQKLPRAI